MTTIEEHVAQTDDAIFDASKYDLPIPRVDGHKADKLTLNFGGSIELDRTSEDDLTLLENLRLGHQTTLQVTAVIAGKGFTHVAKTDDDEQVSYQIRLRVTSAEVTSQP